VFDQRVENSREQEEEDDIMCSTVKEVSHLDQAVAQSLINDKTNDPIPAITESKNKKKKKKRRSKKHNNNINNNTIKNDQSPSTSPLQKTSTLAKMDVIESSNNHNNDNLDGTIICTENIITPIKHKRQLGTSCLVQPTPNYDEINQKTITNSNILDALIDYKAAEEVGDKFEFFLDNDDDSKDDDDYFHSSNTSVNSLSYNNFTKRHSRNATNSLNDYDIFNNNYNYDTNDDDSSIDYFFSK